MNIVIRPRMLTTRRKVALSIISWLYKLAFWLDAHTAPKYDPDVWSKFLLTDAEWFELEREFEEERSG
jgi:hypothetical protein